MSYRSRTTSVMPSSLPAPRPNTPHQAPQSTKGRKMAKMGLGIYQNDAPSSHQSTTHHANDMHSFSGNAFARRGAEKPHSMLNNNTAPQQLASPNASGNIDQLLREFRKELDSIKSMEVVQSKKQLSTTDSMHDVSSPGGGTAQQQQSKYYGEARRALKQDLFQPVVHKFTDALREEEERHARNGHFDMDFNALDASPVLRRNGGESSQGGLFSGVARGGHTTRAQNGTDEPRNPYDSQHATRSDTLLHTQTDALNTSTRSNALNTSTRSNAPSFLPLSEPQKTFHSPAAGLSSLIHSTETQEDIARRKQVNRILGMPDETPLRTPNFKVFEGLSGNKRFTSGVGDTPGGAEHQDLNQLLASLQKNYQQSHDLPSSPGVFTRTSHQELVSDGWIDPQRTPTAQRHASNLNTSTHSALGGGGALNNRSFHSLLGAAADNKHSTTTTTDDAANILSRSTQKKFNDLKSRDRITLFGGAPQGNTTTGHTLGSAAVANADTLRIENMQLRTEVNKLNARVVGLESRVDGLQQNLETLIKLLFDQQQ